MTIRDVDHLVYGEDGGFHPSKKMSLSSSICPTHTPRALVCQRSIRGQIRAWPLWGRDDELDWSVGRSALDETSATDETVFLFTSDNGPWIAYGDHAGVTPFREAKATGLTGNTVPVLFATRLN